MCALAFSKRVNLSINLFLSSEEICVISYKIPYIQFYTNIIE